MCIIILLLTEVPFRMVELEGSSRFEIGINIHIRRAKRYGLVCVIQPVAVESPVLGRDMGSRENVKI